MDQQQRSFLEQAAATYPFPVASVLKRYLDSKPKDSFAEWEILSKEVLLPNLLYLSHLFLADLVASGHKPPHIYPKITDIFNRPTYGRYINFLRETARYYRDNKLNCAFPELLDFLLASEVDRTLLEGNKALLSELVDYRNQISHGRISNIELMDETVAHICQLTFKLLKSIKFLKNYPLLTEDGASLMGWNLPASRKESSSLVVISSGERKLRPLLLKLKGDDVLLLEEADIKNKRLGYKGSSSFVHFKKKDLEKGDGKQIYTELFELLQNIRAITTVLPFPDFDTFKERAALIMDRTLTNYKEMGKYVLSLFISNPSWTGEGNIFQRYLESDRTLLTISGPSGSGKSAQVSQLAAQASNDGHAVLFINAQRFTFASSIEHGVNPFPGYFAGILHYENSFGKDTFKRLLKTAPSGKQVILFIDAINEIDGLAGKWNRFIAIEKLLEWACQVAQPGLKIVLSFRVDLYEEFNYLEPDDEFMPENLNDIAYSGNHPRKPWVCELQSFNEGQAEELYNILQTEPENGKGMAPMMTWEEVKASLGEAFNKITTNPLTFMLFLRAHHKESKVINYDPEAIFDEYVARITGSNEIRKWPWYKKVWGFIQNGNITPKEQIIADLFYKMSRVGNTAILINKDTFNSKKKREKRLTIALNTPNNHALKDLTEGKMLVDETIEYEIGGKQETVRRISFVGELVTPAADKIFLKIERNRAVRFSIFMVILLLFVSNIFLILSFGFLFSQPMMEKYNEIIKYGVNTNFLSFIKSFIVFIYSWIIIMILIVYNYFIFIFYVMKINRIKILNIGIPQFALNQYYTSVVMKKIFILMMIMISLSLLFLTISKLDYKYINSEILISIGLSMLIFSLFFLMKTGLYSLPYQIAYFLRTEKKLLSICAFKYYDYYQKNKKNTAINLRVKLILLIIIIIQLIVSMQVIWLSKPTVIIPYALSYGEFLITIGFKYFNISSLLLAKNCINYTILFTVFIILIIFSFEKLDYFLQIRSFKKLKNIDLQSDRRIKKKLLISFLLCIILTLSFFLIITYKEKLSQLFTPLCQNYYEDGNSVPIEDSLKTNKKISINRNADNIPVFENHELEELYIMNADKIGFIQDIERQFPLLQQISITEDEALLINTNFKNPTQNLLLRILPKKRVNKYNSIVCDSIIAPELKWLNYEYSKAILELTSINHHTQNLNKIKRLFINAGSFDPDILIKADSLEWIRITDHDSVSKEWYEKLSRVVNYELPSIKTLEIQVITAEMDKKLRINANLSILSKLRILNSGCYFGKGRENILAELNKFIKKKENDIQ